jgi:hypothetical protein
MHLKRTHVVTRSRAAKPHAATIPPPTLLSPDLRREWDVITTSHQNVLLLGASATTTRMLHAIEPHLCKPICKCTPKAYAVLPEPSEGTLVVFDVDGLTLDQQMQMFRWLNQLQTRVQVICTSSEPMFCLVQAGGFLTDLYYRLNVVLIDVGVPSDHTFTKRHRRTSV